MSLTKGDLDSTSVSSILCTFMALPGAKSVGIGCHSIDCCLRACYVTAMGGHIHARTHARTHASTHSIGMSTDVVGKKSICARRQCKPSKEFWQEQVTRVNVIAKVLQMV